MRWPNLQKQPPSAEELYKEARNNVKRNWLYWRPIAYGKVTIPSSVYDEATPTFMLEVNVAMDERTDLENEAYEKAKQESGST